MAPVLLPVTYVTMLARASRPSSMARSRGRGAAVRLRVEALPGREVLLGKPRCRAREAPLISLSHDEPCCMPLRPDSANTWMRLAV